MRDAGGRILIGGVWSAPGAAEGFGEPFVAAPDGFGSLGSVLRQLWRTGIRASWAGAQGWGSGDKHDPALRKSRVAQRLGFL